MEKMFFPYEIRRVNCEASIPVARVAADPASVYTFMAELQQRWPGRYLVFESKQDGFHRREDRPHLTSP